MEFLYIYLPFYYMGCAACSEICSSQPKSTHTLLYRVQDKAQYLKKTFTKKQLDQFISKQELDYILKLNALPQFFMASELNFLQAGQFYLKKQRKTVWKLFAIQPLAHTNYIATDYKYNQNPTPVQEKTKQRFYEISLDIKRTYPSTKQLNRKSLEFVLQNLTLYFQNVGYTQGMNFIVGFFLLCGFSQRQSFWLFVHLSWNQNFLLIKNFMDGFTYVNFMVAVFESQMKKSQILSKVCEAIESCGLSSYFYSFSWFLCYFLYSLDEKSTVIIWNYFLTNRLQFSDNVQPNDTQTKIKTKTKKKSQQQNIIQKDRGGIPNIITFALVLLQYLAPQLIDNSSPQQILKVLRNQNLCSQITPNLTEDLILRCYQKNGQIKYESLFELAEKHDKQLYTIRNQNGILKFMQLAILLQKKNQNQGKSKSQNTTKVVEIVGKNKST